MFNISLRHKVCSFFWFYIVRQFYSFNMTIPLNIRIYIRTIPVENWYCTYVVVAINGSSTKVADASTTPVLLPFSSGQYFYQILTDCIPVFPLNPQSHIIIELFWEVNGVNSTVPESAFQGFAINLLFFIFRCTCGNAVCHPKQLRLFVTAKKCYRIHLRT